MRISDSDKSEIATLGKLRSTADRYGDIFLFFFIYLFNIHKKTMAYYPISCFSLVKLVEQKMGNFSKKQTRRFALKSYGVLERNLINLQVGFIGIANCFYDITKH